MIICRAGSEKFIELERQKRTGRRLAAQIAPAVRVAIGEPFGVKLRATQLVQTLKADIGFSYVFDTLFGADITIFNEAQELMHHIKVRKPLFTSCCPGWVQFMESAYPEFREHYVSTCKSPQGYMGELIRKNIPDSYSVAIMPCTKKDWEASQTQPRDVDMVITTAELAMHLNELEIDMKNLNDLPFDDPMGYGSGGAVIFGRTGGVMEAAIRYIYGKPLNLTWTYMHAIPSIKETFITLPDGHAFKAAVIVGLADSKKYMAMFEQGLVRHDFVEVMSCFPAGCISGGGQPRSRINDIVKQRRTYIDALDDGTNASDNVNASKLFR